MWGCIAYYKVPDPKRTKLGPRGLKSVFVGYAENSKAYRLLDLDSNTIVESRDVEFLETSFLNNSTSKSDSILPQNTTMDPNSSTNDNKMKILETPSEPRRSKRA